MRFLEQFVEAPLAGILGWALLHSLWEGAIISAALAAVLLVFRSPRIRYAAACSATLAMAGGFALTLTLLIPAQVHHSQNTAANGFPAWNFLSDHDVSGSWNLDLDAIAPWLGPFWITGVWLFCLLRLVSWISVRKLPSRGVSSRRPRPPPSSVGTAELSHGIGPENRAAFPEGQKLRPTFVI